MIVLNHPKIKWKQHYSIQKVGVVLSYTSLHHKDGKKKLHAQRGEPRIFDYRKVYKDSVNVK